jgi:hypothetical protein
MKALADPDRRTPSHLVSSCDESPTDLWVLRKGHADQVARDLMPYSSSNRRMRQTPAHEPYYKTTPISISFQAHYHQRPATVWNAPLTS